MSAGVNLEQELRLILYKYICLHTRALSGQHSEPCALSALEPFFGDISAARPRLVARPASSDSPRSRGPCPRADPPSPRPSRSASEVARSRLRGLPHAPQSQPCFFTTICRGPPTVPRSRSFFLSLSGSRPSWSRCCCCCCPQHQY